MALKLFLQLSVLLLVAAELTQCDENVKDILARNPQLGYLGKVGNKSYFMDNSTMLTWHEALHYASELNMNLANFSSQDEADFIMTMPVEKLPSGYYWTSGCDRSDWSRFTWNPYSIEEGVPFETFGFQISPYGFIINFCLALQNVQTTNTGLIILLPHISHFVLLQN